MNTEKSDQIVDRYRKRALGLSRKKAEWSHVVAGSREGVFPLLCPSREADWIPGWTAELIHTESGYAEQDCVFRTEMAGGIGPGVWVFTRHEEPALVEIARFTPDLLTQIRVSLEEESLPSGAEEAHEPVEERAVEGKWPGRSEPGGDGYAPRTRVRWEYVLTGLTEAGREMVKGMDSELGHKARSVGLAMDHYLRTGEMIKAGHGGGG